MPKDFLSVADWPPRRSRADASRARELKQLLAKGERPQTLEGRTLAMYFEQPSLRTHVTFEAGMTQLGGHAILLTPEQIGIGTRESAGDVAADLSRWVDVLVARTLQPRPGRGAGPGGHDPGGQRAHRPAASVPGHGRPA